MGTEVLRQIVTADIPVNAITQPRLYAKAVVALGAIGAGYTPTAAQILQGSIFACTPAGPGTFTLPTAALLVAGLAQPQVGTFFEFTIVSLDANNITVTLGVGITLTGIAATFIVNNVSEHYIGYFTNVTAATEAATVVRA